jgi:spore coat polysaccharide biosynthesis protein SpsF
MKTVCIVQARIGSTRLPGKVLLPLGGQTVLWHVLTRCRDIQGVDEVVLAVPNESQSDALADVARTVGVGIFRGPEDDVLGRYMQAAFATRAEVVMRITADCPMIDPVVCAEVLSLFLRSGSGVSYVSNVFPRTYPKGLDCEVFFFTELRSAFFAAKDQYDRAHVTPWLQRNCVTISLPGPGEGEEVFCIDTQEDYERLSRLFEQRVAA